LLLRMVAAVARAAVGGAVLGELRAAGFDGEQAVRRWSGHRR